MLDPVGAATMILAIKVGNSLRGIGGWPNGDGHSLYGISATVSGDTWTMQRCQSMVHKASGNHGALANDGIEHIYGIV